MKGYYNTGGVWCFRLSAKLDPRTVTVVASPLERETPRLPPRDAALPADATFFSTAQWVAGGWDCHHDQIEIKTTRYYGSPTGLVAEPSNEVAFSFVVLR
jgi:hypothetical protein